MVVLIFLFIVVPLAELYVIIEVGRQIGALPTIAILVADSIIGSLLLRAQGRAAWRRFNEALRDRRPPAREVLDGALIIFGGALLLTPGFLSDILGVILLLPPSRAVVRGALVGWFGRRFLVARVAGGAASAGARRAQARRPGGRAAVRTTSTATPSTSTSTPRPCPSRGDRPRARDAAAARRPGLQRRGHRLLRRFGRRSSTGSFAWASPRLADPRERPGAALLRPRGGGGGVRGGVELAQPGYAPEELSGLGIETVERLARWRARFEDEEGGFDLDVPALGPPLSLEGGDPAGELAASDGYEQLCWSRGGARRGRRAPRDCPGQRGHTWGAPDWGRIELTRALSIWLGEEGGFTLAAARPARAEGHAEEAVSALLAEPRTTGSRRSTRRGFPRPTTAPGASGAPGWSCGRARTTTTRAAPRARSCAGPRWSSGACAWTARSSLDLDGRTGRRPLRHPAPRARSGRSCQRLRRGPHLAAVRRVRARAGQSGVPPRRWARRWRGSRRDGVHPLFELETAHERAGVPASAQAALGEELGRT